MSFEHVWERDTSNIGYAVGNIGCRCARRAVPDEGKVKITENDILFQKVTQAYSEKNPSAPIRSRT